MLCVFGDISYTFIQSTLFVILLCMSKTEVFHVNVSFPSCKRINYSICDINSFYFIYYVNVIIYAHCLQATIIFA